MRSHADKKQDNKSNSAAHKTQDDKQGKQSSFKDNRPETIAQLKLHEEINNSSRAQYLQSFQTMANNSLKGQQAAQLQAMANQRAKQTMQLIGPGDEEKEEDEEKTMQGKFNPVQKKPESSPETPSGKNNTGLPDNLKAGVENLSGMDMSDVKVHYNSDKPSQLQAHAYAQGTDIHLASGQEKHLPHETWHVVQQKQGRVKPTKQLKEKVNVNDDIGLEKEADVMSNKAFLKGQDVLVRKGIYQQKRKALRHPEVLHTGQLYAAKKQK